MNITSTTADAASMNWSFTLQCEASDSDSPLQCDYSTIAAKGTPNIVWIFIQNTS